MKLKYIIILFVLIAFIFSNNNINISSKSNLHNIPTIVMPYIDNNQELIKTTYYNLEHCDEDCDG